jgi:mono/diheme cytochrome c family protein
MRRAGGLLLLGALWCGAGACGPARRGELFNRPLQFTAEELDGQKLFMRECNQCHPAGAAGLGPAINNKPLPSVAMRTQIRLGAGAMPAFKEDALKDAEVDAIVAYLNKLQQE